MKKHYLTLCILILLKFNDYGQCTFTTAISTGSSNIACGSAQLSVPSDYHWTPKANFGGGGRRTAVGFSINGKGYIGTGDNAPIQQSDFWEYDPISDTWTQKANFGGGIRNGAASFVIGNKGYVGTGYDGSSRKNDLWEYDPISNVWTQKANFGGTARTSAIGFSIGNKGYVGTGYDGGGSKSDFWEYNSVTDTWTRKSDMPGLNRFEAVGFSIGSKGYIGTGLNYATNAELNDFYEYDPALDLWSQKAFFAGVGRRGAVGISQGIHGYIGTGYSNTYVLNDFFEYNPATNTWNSFLGLGAARDYGVGFSIGEDLYFGTGRTNFTNSAYPEFWICRDSYNYNWSNGDTSSVSTVTTTNNYSVVVTNSAGCTASASQSVIINPKPSLSLIGQTNVFCKNEATGSATVSATGGSLVTYTWSPVVSNDTTVTGLTAGIYTCTATNSFGCTDTKLILVKQPTTTLNYTTSVNNTFCIGKSTGSASITISGGGSPYTYIWSSGATTSVVTNLAYGTYSVAITDANNCVKTNSVFIGESNHYNTSISVNGPTVSCGSGTLSANTDYKWNQKASFPAISRDRPVAFSIGGYGYIGTGNNGGYKNDFWLYNPASNSWTQVANFGGVARQGAVGFSIGGLGYVGTGYNGSYKNDFWEYNPGTNIWTQKANFGGTARQFAFAFAIGNKGYVGAGYGGSTANDVWEYDPSTNTWTQKSSIPATKVCAVGFTIANKGYVGSGWSNLNDFWEYDPNLNNWTQKAPLPGGTKNYAVGFSINNKGYIGAGDDGGTYKKDFWEYNPLTNLWAQKDNFGGGVRSEAIGFSIGNKGYMGLGTNGSSYQNDFWEYTTSNNFVWSNSSTSQIIYPTTSGLYSVTATAPDGCVGTASQTISVNTNPTITITPTNVVCNGENSGSASAIISGGTSPFSYLWSTGDTTSVISNLAVGSYSLSVTDTNNCVNSKVTTITQSLPINSSISVSGSTISCGSATLNALSDGVWIQKANFGAGTRSYAVGLSIGNKGYIGTGYNSGYKNDFWEYDPATNAWTQKANFGGTARSGATAFSIGSKGYVGTGYNGSCMQDFWEFDPLLNSWTQKGNFAGGARSSATSFSIGNKAYVGIGSNGTTYKQDFWEYNPATDIWTQKTNFGGGLRAEASGFSVIGKGYVGIGHDISTYKQDFWEYDPATDIWTQKTNFGGGIRHSAVAFHIGSKGYIATGLNFSTRKNDFWEYDPVGDTWTQRINVGGTLRNCAVGFTIGSKAYIGTGLDNTTNKSDFWEYNASGTYVWSDASTTPSINVTASGNYSVLVTSVQGCTTTASQSVIINPNPPVIVNSGSICKGNSFNIIPNGADTYTITGGNLVVSPTVTTNYTLTGADANGCTDTAVSTIIVNNLPSVTASSTSTILCTGQTATIIANGANDYLWNDNSTNSSLVVTPNLTTTYTIMGTDVNGCSSTAIITQSVTLCTGIVAQNNVALEITMYPNPTTGLLLIDLSIDREAEISVLNSLGQSVYESVINEKRSQINLSDLNNGIYVVRIIIDHTLFFQQIVITK